MLDVFHLKLLRNQGGFDRIIGIPRLYSVDVKISVRTPVSL